MGRGTTGYIRGVLQKGERPRTKKYAKKKNVSKRGGGGKKKER